MRAKRESWSSEGGFTVTELIVTMALIAIVAVIVNPSIAPFAQRASASAAADEFMAVHELARSTAIKYGRSTELHLDASRGRFWVQIDTVQAGATDTVAMVSDLTKRGVRMTTDRTVLCFDARGVATGRGTCGSGLATVVFRAQSHQDTVWITAAGNAIR
jgi:prepilin-type N-terminal cleavage/methylation domain-containing protein